ncbi:MAG: hypothetical protein ACMZ64_02040 [Oleiphilus sp.]
MKIYIFTLLATLFLLTACSGGSSENEGDRFCRSYSTSSMDEGGLTETCSFNKDTFVLSCTNPSLSYEMLYDSVEDFVIESKTLGLLKAKKRIYDHVEINYIYEDNQLKTVNLDFTSTFGSGYINTNHNVFDNLNRPISGITESDIDSNCSDLVITLEYNDSDKSVKTIVPSNECPYFINLETTFDQDGNIIRSDYDSFTKYYTVMSTEVVCI